MSSPKRFIVFAIALLAALAGDAQTRDVVIAPADVDQVVTGVSISFLPDGGCALAPILSGAPGGVQVQPTVRPFGGARCQTVQNATARAAYLDAQVGDGGAP